MLYQAKRTFAPKLKPNRLQTLRRCVSLTPFKATLVLAFQPVKGSAPAYLKKPTYQKIIRPYTPARPLRSTTGTTLSPHFHLPAMTTVCSGSPVVKRPPRSGKNGRDSGHLQAQTEDTPLQAAPLPTPPYHPVISNY